MIYELTAKDGHKTILRTPETATAQLRAASRDEGMNLRPLYQEHNVVFSYMFGSLVTGTSISMSDINIGEVYLDSAEELFVLNTTARLPKVTHIQNVARVYDVELVPLVTFIRHLYQPKLIDHAKIMTLTSERIDVVTLQLHVQRFIDWKQYIYHSASYIRSRIGAPTPKTILQATYASALVRTQMQRKLFIVSPHWTTLDFAERIQTAISARKAGVTLHGEVAILEKTVHELLDHAESLHSQQKNEGAAKIFSEVLLDVAATVL